MTYQLAFWILYLLAGLTVGGVVGFFGALGNNPRYWGWAIVSAIAWPLAIAWFAVLCVWRMR